MNRRRHVLTEETLDEIGEKLEHNPQKCLKRISQETDVCTKTTKLLKLHIRIVNIHKFAQ